MFVIENCSLLHLNPSPNFMARRSIGVILELIPCMCKHCIVCKNHVSSLKGLMEAACIIEVIIQYIHGNLEEVGNLPISLLMTCFDPMAHVTETEDVEKKEIWLVSTNKHYVRMDQIKEVLPHAVPFDEIDWIRVVFDTHSKNCR